MTSADDADASSYGPLNQRLKTRAMFLIARAQAQINEVNPLLNGPFQASDKLLNSGGQLPVEDFDYQQSRGGCFLVNGCGNCRAVSEGIGIIICGTFAGNPDSP